MALSKELRDVRRQQALERKIVEQQRKRVRERMDEARQQQSTAESINRHNAIVTGMVPRISGAIDSWVGHRVPLTVTHPSYQFRAMTDFETITIDIPLIEDVTVDFAADLRGLAYHEAGHVLVSVPFMDMIDHVMPLERDVPIRDADEKRRIFIEKLTGMKFMRLHQSWNMLEDQRMETAMVRSSKNLGRYYNVIVLTHVLTHMRPGSYLLLHGRRHVDADVRTASRVKFTDTYGEDKTLQAEALIDAYKRSNDLAEMWQQVIAFAHLIEATADTGDGIDAVDGHEFSGQPLDPKEVSKRMGRGSMPAGEKGDEKNEEDKKEDEASGPGEIGDPAGKGTGTWNREDIRQALQEAREERNNDGQIVNDIKAYNHALHNARNRLPLPRIAPSIDPDPTATTAALRLNQSLRRLMEQARAEQAPSWQSHQRRGILDVRGYVTRQPGQSDFYRNYAEGGDLRLPNMAVSVVLDGSGSMSHAIQELAIAAFGMKSACDVVGIPCTVTVYDTHAHLLWDQDDTPREVPYNIAPLGGTEPKRCLDMLDLQKAGKANHLVIIMTDGAWSYEWRGRHSLAHYAAPDRDIVMFYYRCNPRPGPAGVEACSLVQRIDDLNDLPRFLTRYITKAM